MRRLMTVALIFGLTNPCAAALPTGKPPPGRGVFVLDDCDPEFKGKERYADNLSYYRADGQLVFRVTGFNIAGSIGCQHKVAVDQQRRAVWVCDEVSRRVRKFDFSGKELHAISEIHSHALAVDP